jgi:small subunit ribosomal protein S2
MIVVYSDFMTQDEYLSTGVHIGLKQITKDMKKFVYKKRPDGLAVLDVKAIDERIKTAASFLAKHKKIIVVSRKGNGKKPVVKFCEAIGGKAIIGRFLPGIITNPSFRAYFEPDVLLVTDPTIDKQALAEAVKMRVPIVSLCGTNNETNKIDLVIPCNNKGRRSIATVYMVLAREVLKARGEITKDTEFTLTMKDFEPTDREAKEVRREKPLRGGRGRGGPPRRR